MKNSKLLSSFQSESLQLQNHVVMAPMTRSRAIGNIPNNIMAEYYGLRANAGLIITEATSPSKNGLGYPNIPAVYSDEQIEGWKKTTEAVHKKGGKIFLQIMHTGRISHELNLPEGGEVLAPSAIQAAGEMFTMEGVKAHTTPREMTLQDIKQAQEEYVQAAKNAIVAGFDGVEIHAANGYLANQFLNKGSNQRKDEYGGSVENRSRFVLELATQISNVIGNDKTGIRISPFGEFNDMALYDEIPATFDYLIQELNTLDLAYLHLAALSQNIPDGYLEGLAAKFNGNIIFNGGFGYDLPRAEKTVSENDRYLVSIGVPFIANPDLIARIEQGAKFNQPDQNTFYTPGEEGYLTYPTLAKAN
ncbi:N-ethylmaleimide reductase [Wenyingzhuangia heitensis]|uniref:N-ethylmaleimide reductase n=1 Tax=Wenyingzhuangia heitensis TaxID=1487859 RepID=A0ABX0UCY5_9FLAO|nr:alkene reductase [Wenyingzhuangia heitensis]NIJ45016.1 N-ethylmaleimide reductase [Wenyingzhuangia heitensis]